MNSKTRIVLAGAAFMAACAMTRAQSPAVVAPQPNSMAAADNPMMGPAPSHDHVWMSGHWNSEGGQWKWVAGHWDLPPSRSAIWVAGHWIQGSGGWEWMNGAWNVAEAPQSPSAPPTPPGQDVSQGAPMPSTPAPNVQGEYYAPDGQVPVADQGAMVTDYGPVDYSVVSPGYYWTGDAWAWGIYPGLFYYGVGWGPGYFGGGRGYFGGGRGYFRGSRGYVRGGYGAGGRGFSHGFSHAGGGHFR